MNKTELINKVADSTGLTKKDVTATVDSVFEAITDELANGGDYSHLGFGKFSSAVRSARKGNNPSTGETIDIPEKRVPKFKAGKHLKEQVAQES